MCIASFVRHPARNHARAALALIALAAGGTVGTAGLAQPQPGAKQSFVQGVGNLSCGRWTAEQPPEMGSPIRTVFTNWLAGYVSGYNAWRGGNVLDGTDWDSELAWMDQYCVAHPAEPVASAAGQLIIKLDGRKLHAKE
jgi:hypothetical protein